MSDHPTLDARPGTPTITEERAGALRALLALGIARALAEEEEVEHDLEVGRTDYLNQILDTTIKSYNNGATRSIVAALDQDDDELWEAVHGAWDALGVSAHPHTELARNTTERACALEHNYITDPHILSDDSPLLPKALKVIDAAARGSAR
jgi:hypothetical protein